MNVITDDDHTEAKKIRTTVNLAPDIQETAKRRARQEHRSVSNYLETLIVQDAVRSRPKSRAARAAKSPAPSAPVLASSEAEDELAFTSENGGNAKLL